MSLAEIVLLGLIQGVTEFLPVSSSAHLVIFQNLFGVKEPQLFLDAALHLGTLIATVIVLRNEILALLKGLLSYALHQLRGEMHALGDEQRAMARLAGRVCIGLIPTGLLGFLFRDQFERLFGSLLAVGIMLMITGGLLWMTRGTGKGTKDGGTISVMDALVVGFIQGLAIAPGISRSGSTISFGLFRNFKKGFSFHFSFLISIPAIVGAMVLEWEAPALSSRELLQVLAGTLTAAVAGYLCLRLLRTIVQEGRLYFFSPYCWAAGSAAVALSFILQ
jgi:undecaprenyl-diphosphatase